MRHGQKLAVQSRFLQSLDDGIRDKAQFSLLGVTGSNIDVVSTLLEFARSDEGADMLFGAVEHPSHTLDVREAHSFGVENSGFNFLRHVRVEEKSLFK